MRLKKDTHFGNMRGAWQKNNGMRIDHFLVSNSLIDQVKSININKDPRGRKNLQTTLLLR